MKAALATLSLLSALAAQATPALGPGPVSPGAGAAVLQGVPASAPEADTAASEEVVVPPREATIAVLKDACATRAERVVRLAAPEALADPSVVERICACSGAALDATAPDIFVDTLPDVAERATLSCARPPITAHNQGLTRQRFADYLAQQGWTAEQVDTFSLCLAQGYWQDTFEGALQGRPSRLKGSVLWADCATRVGETGTPLPAMRAASASSDPR